MSTVTLTMKTIGSDNMEADIEAVRREMREAQKDAREQAKAAAEAQKEAAAAAKARISEAGQMSQAAKALADQVVSGNDKEQAALQATAKTMKDTAAAQVAAARVEQEAIRTVIMLREGEAKMAKAAAQEMRASVDQAKAQTALYREIERQTKAADKSTREQAAAVRQGGTAAQEASLSWGKLATAMGIGFSSAALVQGAIARVGEAFRFAVEQGASYESSMRTLQIVSERTGGNFANNKKLIQEYSDAISSPAAVAQAVRVFQTMNLSMDTQSKLITGIRDGIVAMGGDVHEQLPLMALAIKRQESQLLDNMGVTKTIETMYKEFAVTIGTTADKLTQQQKEQAIVNGTLKELNTYSGVATSSLDTYQGSVNRLNSAMEKLGTTVGTQVNPYMAANNKIMATFAEELDKAARASIIRPIDPMESTPTVGDKGQPIAPSGVRIIGGGGFKLNTPQEQARADEAATAARAKAAADAAKRAQDEAKRIAQDRKQLQEQLTRELALVGKQGHDRERAEEGLHYQEQLRMAHGNAALKEQIQRAHVARLAEIHTKELEDAAKRDAEATDRKLKRQQAQADEEDRIVRERAAEQEKYSTAADGIRGQAIALATSTATKAIRGEEITASDVSSGVGSVAGGAIGLFLGGPGGAALGAQLGGAAGDLLASIFDRAGMDERKRAEEQAAKDQAEAARVQKEAAEKQAEAARQATIRTRGREFLGSTQEDLQALKDEQDLKAGRITQAEYDRRQRVTAANSGASGAVKSVADILGNTELASSAWDMVLSGDRTGAEGLIGKDLTQALVNAMEIRDRKINAPGSSPQNPLYAEAKITNPRDFWSFMPQGASFRAAAPTPTSNRAINLGRAV